MNSVIYFESSSEEVSPSSLNTVKQARFLIPLYFKFFTPLCHSSRSCFRETTITLKQYWSHCCLCVVLCIFRILLIPLGPVQITALPRRLINRSCRTKIPVPQVVAISIVTSSANAIVIVIAIGTEIVEIIGTVTEAVKGDTMVVIGMIGTAPIGIVTIDATAPTGTDMTGNGIIVVVANAIAAKAANVDEEVIRGHVTVSSETDHVPAIRRIVNVVGEIYPLK